jgi:hypothetical protein
MLNRLYLTWKSLPLPWRREILVGKTPSLSLLSTSNPRPGTDLSQNTYWRTRRPPHRRTVRPASAALRSAHPSVAAAEMATAVPPQWSQWLRRARDDAPGVKELHDDVARRERLRALVARRAEEERLRAVAAGAAPAVAGPAGGGGAPAAAGAEPEGAALARAARSAGVRTAARAAGPAAGTETVVAAAGPSPWAAADAAARRKNPGDDGPEAWKPQAKPR